MAKTTTDEDVDPQAPDLVYAFKCRNCGFLEQPEHAGERDVPAACRVCGKGVTYSVNDAGIPVKKHDPENWIVLADLDGDGVLDLVEQHKIDPDKIVRHEPVVNPDADPEREPQVLDRTADDNASSEDAAGVG